jgi:flagellar biosynthetic protein FliR
MSFDLSPLIEIWTYQFMLVFARVGGAVMLLPGFGDMRVPVRVRLLFALALTSLVLPGVAGQLPAQPAAVATLAAHIGRETAVGLFIGATAGVIMSLLHMAGAVIAGQIGLGNALSGELFSAEQGASIGAALMAGGLVIIFTTGLDHLMLTGLVRSYDGLPAAGPVPWSDLAETLGETLSAAFAAAIQLSTPFLLLGLVFNVGLALANRALPQLPVFFVGLPASLAGGILVLMIALPAILLAFADTFENLFSTSIP